ncbi:MAG: hypothetical protein RMN25_14875, partial [Anaerolineae bacterium]|nr:hypothetical protein [Thermoflexales bacterium]MDW8409054.1 hypothetical protein [Anaerolineae bacterium]
MTNWPKQLIIRTLRLDSCRARASRLVTVAGAGCAALALSILGVRLAHAQLPPPTAQDPASHSVYNDGWQTGD